MSVVPTLFLLNKTDTSITFGWNFGDTPDSFQVTRNSPDYKVLIPTRSFYGSGGSLPPKTYTDTGLNPGTDYVYAVTANFGAAGYPGSLTVQTSGSPSGGSSSGSPVNMTGGQTVYPAKPVTNLVATALDYKSIRVTWTNPGDGSQLQLYRFNPDGAFYMVYEANYPGESYVDTQGGLWPGFTYHYQVWTGLLGDAYFTKVTSNNVTLPPFDLRQFLQSRGVNLKHGYDVGSANPAVTSIRAMAGL